MKKLLGSILAASAYAVSATSAYAVVVPFDAFFRLENRDVAYVGQSIVRDFRIEERGSGRASVSSRTGNGRISVFTDVSVGPGAGRALVTGTVISTFDILFPSFRSQGFLIDIIVPSVPGSGLRSGETASLQYDLSIEAGLPTAPQLALNGSGFYTCSDILCDPDRYTNDGDFTVIGDTFLQPGKNCLLPVVITAAFTLEAAATPVPEPAPIAMVAIGLCVTLAVFRRRRCRHILGSRGGPLPWRCLARPIAPLVPGDWLLGPRFIPRF